MILLAIKRVFLCCSLFLLSSSAMLFSRSSEGFQTKLKYLLDQVETKKGEGESEIHHFLSLKKNCEEYKATATACCVNPNQCSSMIMNIAKHAAPVLPALYSAYESYRNSKKTESGKISHEEAVAKMCDTNNKAAMGGYLAGALSQLGALAQTTCADRIKKCQKQCNSDIQDFKKIFKEYFYSQIQLFKDQKSTFEDMAALSKVMWENKGDSPSWQLTQQQSCHKKAIQLCLQKNTTIPIEDITIEDITKEHVLLLNNCACTAEISHNDKKLTINKRDLALLLLLYKAYSNSALPKVVELTEKSDEQEIVACSKQKHRVAAPSGRPGAPVSPPALQLCQKAAEHVMQNPPPTPSATTQTPMGQGSLAGNQLSDTKSQDLSSILGDDCEDCGVTDDIPDTKTRAPLSKNPPGFVPSSGGGGLGGGGLGGGGLGGGGLGGGGGDEEWGDYGASSDEGGNIPASFAGGDSYPNFASNSGDSSLAGGELSSDPSSISSEAGGSLAGMDSEMSENGLEDKQSIFHLMSQRIQQFCSGQTCMK